MYNLSVSVCFSSKEEGEETGPVVGCLCHLLDQVGMTTP